MQTTLEAVWTRAYQSYHELIHQVKERMEATDNEEETRQQMAKAQDMKAKKQSGTRYAKGK